MPISFHRGSESLEQRLQVGGTRARLGMPLKGERRAIGPFEALEGAVKQRAVRGANIPGQRVLLDGEAVVLARDHDSPGIELDDGVIRAVMTELHFFRL